MGVTLKNTDLMDTTKEVGLQANVEKTKYIFLLLAECRAKS
jgi:hypothetical protein